MKAESYILVSDTVRNNAIRRMQEIPCDGKMQVTFSSAGSKSARQRGLQWRWNDDVAKSGMGGEHEDTKEGVHLVSKYRWAIPIFIRDDPFFADLFIEWRKLYGGDKERMMWFVDNQVHTENFNIAQMAEFLTSFQEYYISNGVSLTSPEDRGLLNE